MAKYKLQEMPDVHHDGKRRVYPKMIINRTLSRKEFVEMMHDYHRGTSPSMVEAVLIDVEDMLVRMLSMGYNVNLGNLGHYSLSLEFKDDKPAEMRDEDDKMIYRRVGVKDVNYKAAPEFVKEVKLETDQLNYPAMSHQNTRLLYHIPERLSSTGAKIIRIFSKKNI